MSWIVFAGLAFGGFLQVICSQKWSGRTWGIVLLLICLLGMARYGFAASRPHTISQYTNGTVQVSGMVTSEVEQRASGQRFVLHGVQIEGEEVSGNLLVFAPFYPEVSYGNELHFSCALKSPEPFEGFAYDAYLATRGVYAICYRAQFIDIDPGSVFHPIGVLLAIKQFLMHVLQNFVPEPHASFLAGLVFGGSSTLSPDVQDDFARTGTSHILAASGFNVSLFTLIFFQWVIQTPLGRRRGIICTAFLLILYLVLAGMTPSVVRAGIMASVLMLAGWVRRVPWIPGLFFGAMALLLLQNPLILHADVGFQLSFVAVAALLLFTRSIEQYVMWIPHSLVRSSFAASLAAIIGTLPIMLWHFGTISLVAPFVNLLVLPLIPFVVACTLVGFCLAMILPLIGSWFFLPAWAGSVVLLWVIAQMGSLEWASLSISFSNRVAVLCAVALTGYVHKKHATTEPIPLV